MSVIIRLQNLPLSASAMDIRSFFNGLSIPDGGVHIVGGKDGDAFIAFSSDEDARKAMILTGQKIKASSIQLFLSSRNEMCKVIEQARQSSSSNQDQNRPVNIPGGSGLKGPSNNSQHETTRPPSSNTLPVHLGMQLGGFTGLNNMGIPESMNPFQNLKMTPQQLSTLMPGTAAVGLLQQQASGLNQAQNPFMLPTPIGGLALQGGPTNNPMFQQTNPMAFQSVLPGMIPQSILPAYLNPAAASLHVAPNQPQPFNSNASRMGLHQHTQFTNNIPNPNILQNGSGHPNINQGQDRIRLLLPPPPPIPADVSKTRTIIRDREREEIRDDSTDDDGLGRLGRLGKHRSNSPERRGGDRERRRRSPVERERSSRRDSRKSRSRSRSRSRNRNQQERPSSARRNSSRNNSRERSFSEVDSRRSSTTDLDLIIDEGGDTESACIMLHNVPNVATYRDIREFLRVETRRFGIMRDFEEGTACVRLDNPIDLERAIRNDGRKLNGQQIQIQVVSLDTFEREARRRGVPMEYNREADVKPRNRNDKDLGDRGYRDRERSMRNDEECCLVIQGLPVNFTGTDVATVTLEGVDKTSYSDIHIHEEPGDRDGRQFATAFVKFINSDEAQRAIGLVARTQGSHLKLQVTNIGELTKIRQSFMVPSRRDGEQRPSLFDLDLNMDSSDVMLEGVPQTATDRDIFEFFMDVGLTPKRVKFLTGSRLGEVLCEFNDPSQAKRAATKDGRLLERINIGVRVLPKREEARGNPPVVGRQNSFGDRPASFQSQSRLPRSPNESENPFVQAMNASVGSHPPVINDIGIRGGIRGGFRGSRGGPARGGGRGGVRPSRFAQADSTTSDNYHWDTPPSLFDRPGCVLAITNLPFGASLEQITSFLSENIQKNVPHERIIRRYDEQQKPTGDVRLAFDNNYETKQAFEKIKGTRMWNRLLDICILGK